MLKIIAAGVLIVHGLGHMMGFFAAWSSLSMGFIADKPWIFSHGVMVDSTVGKIFGLFWLVALVGFAGAGYGLLVGESGWRVLAIIAAVISLVVILPWWNTVTPGSRLWASLVDVIVLVALLGWGDKVVKGLQ